MYKLYISLLLILFMMPFVAGDDQKQSPANPVVVLAATTSVRDSGLMDYLLPHLVKHTGLQVKVIAVGSGQAFRMGRDGEADVLLVHARADEEKFIAEGHGLERRSLMYNDFILVGPINDPAAIGKESGDIVSAFARIAASKAKFLSRGDDSGTHKREQTIWLEAGIKPAGDWYVLAGRGMGEMLIMADELQAYTLSDRATYLTMKNRGELAIIKEGDMLLRNFYALILVNPAKNDKINAAGARAFVEWMVSPATQKLIGQFGVDRFGIPLFYPDAK